MVVTNAIPPDAKGPPLMIAYDSDSDFALPSSPRMKCQESFVRVRSPKAQRNRRHKSTGQAPGSMRLRKNKRWNW